MPLNGESTGERRERAVVVELLDEPRREPYWRVVKPGRGGGELLGQRSLIGAWCFVDHYGPDDVATAVAISSSISVSESGWGM